MTNKKMKNGTMYKSSSTLATPKISGTTNKKKTKSVNFKRGANPQIPQQLLSKYSLYFSQIGEKIKNGFETRSIFTDYNHIAKSGQFQGSFIRNTQY